MFDSCWTIYIFTELLRLEGTSGSVLQLLCSEQQQVAQDHVQLSFEHLQGWRPLWVTCSSVQSSSQ